MLFRNLLVILGFTGVGQAIYFYTRLPDTVAIHFRTSGIPDGWASNEANLVISICLYVFIAGLFLAIPSSLKTLPEKYMNFPNKEYWFSAQRKDTTIKRMAQFLHVFGSILLLFFLLLGYLVFSANLSDPVVLNERIIWIAAAVLTVFIVLWLILFYRQFKIPQ